MSSGCTRFSTAAQKAQLCVVHSINAACVVVQIIPWTRMDHKFCLTMPDHDSKAADDGPKGAKQSRGKAHKASTSTSIYPLMYALELRQPSWLTSICSAAKAFFLLSADKVDCTQLEASYTDAAKDRVFSPEAEKACTEAMSQWADTSTGANNPPTALYRCVQPFFPSCFDSNSSSRHSTTSLINNLQARQSLLLAHSIL